VVPAGAIGPGGLGPKVLLVEKEADSTAVSIGYPWELSRRHPDYPAMFLAMSAFGEHRQFNGRLMRDLRGARGLNYGDYAYVESFIQESGTNLVEPNIARSHQLFSIWLRPVENKNRLFAIRAALWEARRLASGGLRDDEVERTRQFLAGYTWLYTQTDSRRLGYALDERFYGTPRFLDGLREKMAKLGAAEVNAAIKRWIDPGRLRVAVVTKDAESLRRAMLADAPSPIAYDAPKPKAILDEDREIERLPLGLGDKDVALVKVDELFER
jgi:zinc protease